MFIPPGHTEASVLDIIKSVARLLRQKYKFGCHEAEDIEQTAIMLMIEALPRFRNETGKLQNFLYSHARNRLLNKRRNEEWRCEPSCKLCHAFVEGTGEGHGTGEVCERYKDWMDKNRRKTTLCGKGIGATDTEHGWKETATAEDETTDTASASELARLIDSQLPIELRADYLRLRDGAPLDKRRREAVQAAVKEILDGRVAKTKATASQRRRRFWDVPGKPPPLSIAERDALIRPYLLLPDTQADADVENDKSEADHKQRNGDGNPASGRGQESFDYSSSHDVEDEGNESEKAPSPHGNNPRHGTELQEEAIRPR